MQRTDLKNLVLGAMFLALCLVLPLFTGQIPTVGSMLLPMHLPVLLCGFVCGWPYGLAVGAIAPLLRSVTFGMPPMMPTAVAMAFELAAYGLLCGLLYKALPKRIAFVYVSLLLSMVGGRIVWGFVMYLITGSALTFEVFLSAVIINAVPGIILQIVLIPLIVIALNRSEFIKKAVN